MSTQTHNGKDIILLHMLRTAQEGNQDVVFRVAEKEFGSVTIEKIKELRNVYKSVVIKEMEINQKKNEEWEKKKIREREKRAKRKQEREREERGEEEERKAEREEDREGHHDEIRAKDEEVVLLSGPIYPRPLLPEIDTEGEDEESLPHAPLLDH